MRGVTFHICIFPDDPARRVQSPNSQAITQHCVSPQCVYHPSAWHSQGRAGLGCPATHIQPPINDPMHLSAITPQLGNQWAGWSDVL